MTWEAIITLRRARGLKVAERPNGGQKWVDGVRSGKIAEVFACGTRCHSGINGYGTSHLLALDVGHGGPAIPIDEVDDERFVQL